MAGQCKVGRQHIIDRDLLPAFQNRLLTEIQAEDLRTLCTKIKERGALATAVRLRDIVKQVYVYAIAHGEKVGKPCWQRGAVFDCHLCAERPCLVTIGNPSDVAGAGTGGDLSDHQTGNALV